MFVIMGASGRVRSAVLDAVSESGRRIRGICRRPGSNDRVEWLSVDALDSQALIKAFKGAEAVFVMNPVAPDADDVWGQAARLSTSVAEALLAAGVPYAVALSSQGAHLPQGTGIVTALHGFEVALRKTGTPITFLRPAYFMESWVPAAMIAAEGGQMPALLDPLDRAIDSVSARDVGKVAGGFLMSPQPGIVNITGRRRYSELDAAAILSRKAGRDIHAVPVPASEIAAFYRQAGLGASFAEGIAGMYAALNGDGIPFDQAGAKWVHGETPLEAVLADTR